MDIQDSVLEPNRLCSPGLEKLLLRLGVLSADTTTRLLSTSPNRKIVAALCQEQSTISEEQLLGRIARELSLPLVSGAELLDDSAKLVLTVGAGIDRVFALRHRMIPFRYKGDSIEVACADPLDVEALSELEFRLQARLAIAVASEAAVIRAINRALPAVDQQFAEIEEGASEQSSSGLDLVVSEAAEQGNEEVGCQAAPIVQLVNRILLDAVSLNASDIHLEPNSAELEIRYRVDGVMRKHSAVPRRVQPFVLTRLKLLASMDISEKRRPQDGRFRIRINKRSTRDLRLSTVPTPFGEKIVVRVLAGDLDSVRVEQLGMPPEVVSGLATALSATDQLVVVTGPTGSGKSTTLYAAVQQLKNGERTIITVEDPIEFRIEGLTQIQVDPKIGITFATGLRSILRQDPDVILVGEVRDHETAETALHAAQTGHLVLTSLHTNDAPSAVVRMLDLGVEPYVLAASLRAVLAQRLVRKLCTNCAVPLDRTKATEIASKFGIVPDGVKDAAGCEQCDRSGYRGRTGVYSLLLIDRPIREVIRRRGSEVEIAQLGEQSGMYTLSDSALRLVEQGVTTFEEALRVLGEIAPRAVKKAPSLETKVQEQTAVSMRTRSLAELAQSADVEGTEEKKPSILLIDDDPGVRKILCRILQRANYTVTEAENGEEGLRMLEAGRPDLVVCDLIMPGLGGESFVTEVRRALSANTLPILMLTGNDDESNEITLLGLGANDFVSKTTTPERLLARIKNLLRVS